MNRDHCQYLPIFRRVGALIFLSMMYLSLSNCISVSTAFVVPIIPSLRSSSFSPSLLFSSSSSIDTSFMWNRGLSFGKGDFKFYRGFDSWMGVFPEEDKLRYPEIFNFPKGVYEVQLSKPLGIVFEEIELGKGLYVKDLVENGHAARSPIEIGIGDVLVGITAVKVVGAKYERRLIPARNFDFDTLVGAITSNDPRYGCDNVILVFERPNEADPKVVDQFMRFFEPPFDNPWKQQQ